MFLDRALKDLNRTIISYALPFVDFNFYYKRSAPEIDLLFQHAMQCATPLGNYRESMAQLKTRAKINALLRLSERILPECYLILARLYSVITVAHAFVLAQAILIFLLVLLDIPHNSFITLGALVGLLLVKVGLIRAAASTEMDVLRASSIALDFNKNSEEQR